MRAKFVKGEDPKKSIGIGKHAPVKKGDRVRIRYEYHDGTTEYFTVTALEDQTTEILKLSPDGKNWRYEHQHEFWFKDDDGGICYARKIEDGDWYVEPYNKADEDDLTKVQLSETIKFERGMDPKETLNIGKDRKFRIGDKVPIYNAFEDDYWDSEIVYANYTDETGEIYIDAAIPDLGGIWPITFNETYNEWMIDE